MIISDNYFKYLLFINPMIPSHVLTHFIVNFSGFFSSNHGLASMKPPHDRINKFKKIEQPSVKYFVIFPIFYEDNFEKIILL